jgi:AraC family transcriptional regulator
MSNSDIEQRIKRAVNFINENPSADLSLQHLAELSNYSPFHFQKLFREVVGETPKKYVLRIRLETAAHEVVMFLQKSITEIAFDHGFSSSATFSRAFRSHFGISPSELKRIPHDERFKMVRREVFGRPLLDSDRYFANPDRKHATEFDASGVRIVRIGSIRGIFVSCQLNDLGGITRSLRKIAQLAEVHDLISERTKIVGALYPHQNLYYAVASIESDQPVPRELNVREIDSGKFAVVTVTGTVEETFASMREFDRVWLPSSGYRIADIYGFETFAGDISLRPYEELKREVHIRIEPA